MDYDIDFDDNDVEVLADFFNRRGMGMGGNGGGNFMMRNNWRNQRYDNAFGDYRGGYGPGGGFGPNGPFNNGPFNNGPFNNGPFNNGPFDDSQFELGFGPMRGPPGPPCLPGPPQPLMPRRGRGYGPGGPPKKFEEKVLKYLRRCGIPNEHLKGLPRGLLELIGPDYCGVCGFNFDSFAMARIHYASKNHIKNQKKWIAQKPERGSRNSREIPLKSRDLYCELCDVHITSKTHGESHYAGKAHRSIVEGRKNPKNPALIQRSMQDRVDQLIRREKKHLKALEEKVEAEIADEANEPQAAPKTVPSELRCDICKTSMTCSEQMTAHLNGKRHLAKEKQHILKMMKGEAEEDQGAQATAEENNGGNDEEEQDDKQEEEDANDKMEADGDGEAADDGEEAQDASKDDAEWGNNGDQW